jgi:hypothetical protein
MVSRSRSLSPATGFAPLSALAACLLLCLACLLCLQGCGGIGDSYAVYVDPRFGTDAQGTVLRALDAWEAAVPVHFTVLIGSCSGIHEGEICTHASTRSEIASRQTQPDGTGLGLTLRETTWGHVVDGGEVFIDLPTVEQDYADDFQRVVGHEIGHAMQLEHDAPGNLMSAIATEDAPTPTCADAAEWYAVRGERAPACGPSP